jgi:hypothetical protein
MMEGDSLSVQELGMLFISILMAAYVSQIEHGELEDAHILAVTIHQSLELTFEEVSSGGHPADWEVLYHIHQPLLDMSDRIKNVFSMNNNVEPGHRGLKSHSGNMVIERALCVMAAHRSAQDSFTAELQNADKELSAAAKAVVEESTEQCRLAEDSLKGFDDKVLDLAISHKFCKILLSTGAGYFENLVALGMMKETELNPP